MRLIYDHSIFMEPQVGGVLRHVLEIVRGIHSLVRPEDVAIEVLAGFHHSPINAEDLPPGTFHGSRMLRFKGSTRLFSTINGMAIRRRLARLSDPHVILHETLYGNLVSTPPNVRRVIVIHDTIWEDNVDSMIDMSCVRRKAASIASADGVIFVSEATRACFHKHYPGPRMAAVIHHGCELRMTRKHKNPGVPGPFLLYVGKRGEYKNWLRFARTFAESELCRSHWVVSLGPKPTRDEQQFVATLPSCDRFLWRSGSDDELADFYATADCFVYPSLAEGFGIPLVEAAKLGCPVACSDIPPFREVLGNHACFFPPLDTSAMKSSIVAAVKAGRNGPLSAGAMAACNRYSWHQAVRQTLDFYRRVAAA